MIVAPDHSGTVQLINLPQGTWGEHYEMNNAGEDLRERE